MQQYETPHKARKRFGQNFLHDPAIIGRIVDAINPQQDDLVLEIGPGLGAITEPLQERLEHLHVVEIDRDLIARLKAHPILSQKLTIHEQDALTLNLNDITRDKAQKIRVVGNLPYNISTPLIFHLLSHIGCVQDMHFMLQKEVVERIGAGPGSKQYGRLSVMLAWHCKALPLIEVKPGAFNPPPKVDSAVVRLIPHQAPPFEIGDYQQFNQIVTAAFGQRRKTLRNSLKPYISEAHLEQLGINPTLRAEQIQPAEFGAISASLE